MEVILIPTDFSPASNNAVNYGCELAKYFNAKIILLHSYNLPIGNYETTMPLDALSVIKESAIESLEIIKKELLEKQDKGLSISCIVEMGLADDTILRISKEKSVDLIVMGIVGEAGVIKEHLIGSVATKVARNSTVPVFIIPEGCHYKKIQKMLLACDLDRTEESTLIYLVKYFGNMFGAKLDIVTIVNEQTEVLEKAKTISFIDKKLENINHKILTLKGNDVFESLKTHFILHPADVVIVNPKKHNVFYSMFNESVTKKLAFRAHLPILSIH
jgi:nucleotide-binding universal stress UspA family protein